METNENAENDRECDEESVERKHESRRVREKGE